MRASCRTIVAFSLTVVLVIFGSAARAQPPSPLRGMELYENHCTGCHESRVHIREKRKASSLAQVQVWVRRWASVLELGWDEEEVDAVAWYLNSRYYRY